MKINLNSLSLLNFKGIRNRTVKFGKQTDIKGRNKLGKTTLLDAFLWLLFDKDSTDRKSFEIKTLDEHNQPYHRLSHEVTADITVDGDSVVIRKLFKEKWVKVTGELEKTFKGHTTEFFWDEVPLTLAEFKAKVAKILNEDIFKLITNISYFNTALDWQKRRTVLEQIGGQLSDKQILQDMISGGDTKYQALFDALTGSKTVEDYKKTIASKKKLIEDDLKLIPSRIDEAKRSLPDIIDYDAINVQLEMDALVLKGVEASLMDKTESQKAHQENITYLLNQISSLKVERQGLEFNIKNSTRNKKDVRSQSILDKERESAALNSEINRLTGDWTAENNRLTGLIEAKGLLTNNWTKIDAETLEFNDNDFSCPTCKRAYEADNITEKKNELQQNFNTNKSTRLNDIVARGQKMNDDITLANTNLNNIAAKGIAKRSELALLQEAVNTLKEEHERLNLDEENTIVEAIKNDSGIMAIDQKLINFNEQVNAPQTVDDNKELLQQKNDLSSKIKEYEKQLSTKDQRTKIQARITELTGQESTLSQELAAFEGIEFNILQFSKEKMTALENRINSRFSLVKFKLFEDQINGTEIPCCITLINGVPYPDVNTASRINAGLDIINTLSAHYDVFAPVFVDNAESVNDILHTESQLITLSVSFDNELQVEIVEP